MYNSHAQNFVKTSPNRLCATTLPTSLLRLLLKLLRLQLRVEKEMYVKQTVDPLH